MLCYVLESQPWANHCPALTELAFKWEMVKSHVSRITDWINPVKKRVQRDGTGRDPAGDRGFLRQGGQGDPSWRS